MSRRVLTVALWLLLGVLVGVNQHKPGGKTPIQDGFWALDGPETWSAGSLGIPLVSQGVNNEPNNGVGLRFDVGSNAAITGCNLVLTILEVADPPGYPTGTHTIEVYVAQEVDQGALLTGDASALTWALVASVTRDWSTLAAVATETFTCTDPSVVSNVLTAQATGLLAFKVVFVEGGLQLDYNISINSRVPLRAGGTHISAARLRLIP